MSIPQDQIREQHFKSALATALLRALPNGMSGDQALALLDDAVSAYRRAQELGIVCDAPAPRPGRPYTDTHSVNVRFPSRAAADAQARHAAAWEHMVDNGLRNYSIRSGALYQAFAIAEGTAPLPTPAPSLSSITPDGRLRVYGRVIGSREELDTTYRQAAAWRGVCAQGRWDVGRERSDWCVRGDVWTEIYNEVQRED